MRFDPDVPFETNWQTFLDDLADVDPHLASLFAEVVDPLLAEQGDDERRQARAAVLAVVRGRLDEGQTETVTS